MSSITQENEQATLPLIFLTPEAINPAKEKIDPDAAWQFYSHSIKRFPGNLSLHTHRVFFAITYKDGTFLAGALYDLFYVLKDAGEALRIRLLKAARPVLGETETTYFAKWIKINTKKQMEYRWIAGSVLSKGLFGVDHELITIDKTSLPDESPALTPLEEAQSCIEYGQLEMAQSILQDALKDKTSDKAALKKELDNLQQHLKKSEQEPLESTV